MNIFNKLLFGAIFYKKGAMAALSFFSASILTIFSKEINMPDSFFGLSIGLCVILSLLIIGDSFTGIVASRHEGDKIESGKLAFTFYKFLMSFIFFWIVSELRDKLGVKIESCKSEYLSTFYSGIKETLEIITYSIFVLLSLREWISIGENIERRFKKKIYVFQIVEKIFDIIEKKLITWIENKEICK